MVGGDKKKTKGGKKEIKREQKEQVSPCIKDKITRRIASKMEEEGKL